MCAALGALLGNLCSLGLKLTEVFKFTAYFDALFALFRKFRALYSGSLGTAYTKKIGHNIKSKSRVLKAQPPDR